MPHATSPYQGFAPVDELATSVTQGTTASTASATPTALDTFHDFFGPEYREYNFGQSVASAYNFTVPRFKSYTSREGCRDTLPSIFERSVETLRSGAQSKIDEAIIAAVKEVTLDSVFLEEAHIDAQRTIQQQFDTAFGGSLAGTAQRAWNSVPSQAVPVRNDGQLQGGRDRDGVGNL